MKKEKILHYDDKLLMTNLFIKSGDTKIGGIDIQDPRIDTISLLKVRGLKSNSKVVFEMQNTSVLSTDKFKMHFLTPNNISILYYVFADNYKKYKLTLMNHVLNNDLGNQYSEYNDNFIHRLIMTSKMVYEMIQYAECAIIFGYTTIEAFANYSIPENYSYQCTNNKGIIESYNREAIERNINLSKKLKEMLVPIYGAGDITKEKFWPRFIELERLRNSIVHSKAEEKTLFHKLFNQNTLTILNSINDILRFFSKAPKALNVFPIFDYNGQLKFKEELIDVKDVKNMKVCSANDINNELTLKEILDNYKNK